MKQDLGDHKRILNTVVRHSDDDPGRAVFIGPPWPAPTSTADTQQLVCFEYGKNSTTAWHRDPAARNGVVLYPLTSRSHQLRMHLADPFGLGILLKGYRLYGSPDFLDVQERMMLHAYFISFDYPVSGRRIKLFVRHHLYTLGII